MILNDKVDNELLNEEAVPKFTNQNKIYPGFHLTTESLV